MEISVTGKGRGSSSAGLLDAEPSRPTVEKQPKRTEGVMPKESGEKTMGPVGIPEGHESKSDHGLQGEVAAPRDKLKKSSRMAVDGVRSMGAFQQHGRHGDVIRREVCRVGFDQRNPKPETRNPKPTVKVGFELRNPKPETDSEDLTSPGRIETRNPKPENPKPTLKTYLPQGRSKPETRNRL